MNYRKYFNNNQKLVALPNWKRPRLIVSGEGFGSRWNNANILPASRVAGLVRKVIYQLYAGCAISGVMSGEGSQQDIEKIIPESGLCLIANMLISNNINLLKFTCQVNTENNKCCGYLKIGIGSTSEQKISNELTILNALPAGLAPEVRETTSLDGGKALYISKVPGTISGDLCRKPEVLVNYLKLLRKTESYSIDKHPWILWLNKNYELKSKWLENLSARNWPDVFFHGDFLPWNILVNGAHLYCVDWEYGNISGFPWIDLAFYKLQQDCLVYRKQAFKSARQVSSWINKNIPDLSEKEAQAIINLTGAYGCVRRIDDGYPSNDRNLVWWKKIADICW